MRIRTTVAALALAGIVAVTAGCATVAASDDAAGTDTSASSETTTTGRGGAGGPGGVDASSVTTEDELIALIQAAYGEASLGLHRGHQPIEDVLNEVLAISHDELHVRMEEQGQNLAAVATDIGVDPQTLIDALVASDSTAIDSLLEQGVITQDEADAYLAALEEAYTFRVNWDGEEATPTFSGLDA